MMFDRPITRSPSAAVAEGRSPACDGSEQASPFTTSARPWAAGRWRGADDLHILSGRRSARQGTVTDNTSEMGFFRDLFGSKKRQSPRIAVDWWVDAQLPGTDSYVGFHANDVSSFGVHLTGDTEEAFQRVLTEERGARMLVRVPGQPGTHAVTTQLVWGLSGQGRFETGWKFTQIEDEATAAIDRYIDEHGDDVLTEN